MFLIWKSCFHCTVNGFCVLSISSINIRCTTIWQAAVSVEYVIFVSTLLSAGIREINYYFFFSLLFPACSSIALRLTNLDSLHNKNLSIHQAKLQRLSQHFSARCWRHRRGKCKGFCLEKRARHASMALFQEFHDTSIPRFHDGNYLNNNIKHIFFHSVHVCICQISDGESHNRTHII